MTEKKVAWFTTNKLTYIALLTALQIVLGNLTQIPLLGKQFTLGFLPIAAAGAMMGPWAAAIVGGLGDLVGAHLFPQGAYFFGFTVTAVLTGIAVGLALYRKKPGWLWAALAMVAMAVINLLLNSYWLSILYSSRAYFGWVGARAVTYLVETPVQIVITYFTLLGLSKLKLPKELQLPRDEKKEQE